MTKAAETKQMGWREFERSNDDVKRGDVLKIPLDKITIREGFNPRDITKPETQAKIEGIKHAYKNGKYVPPIEVALVNNAVEVVDGHCRLTAAVAANEELVAEGGLGIASLVCVPFRGNDADRLLHTITGNEGERLTPIEVAEVIKRLKNMGWENKKIQSELNYSASWVEKLVFLGNMPDAVKQLVQQNKVSVDVAVAKVKKEGDAASTTLTELVYQVKPGEKVTSKHIAKPKTEKAEVYDRARDLAFELPEFGFKKSDIRVKETYKIEVNGKVLKMLIELQDKLAGEAA